MMGGRIYDIKRVLKITTRNMTQDSKHISELTDTKKYLS